MFTLLLTLATTVLAIHLSLRWRAGTLVKDIPGPPSPSFIFGNLVQLLLPYEYGEDEFKWQKLYGAVYRIKGCFGEDRLVVSDPTALKKILNDPAVFHRSTQQQEIVNMLIGKEAVFYVTGDDHRRVRNVMNAAFAPSRIRELTPIFEFIAEKLVNKWEELMTKSTNDIVDVYHSIHSATLDGVGNGAIGYDFGALDGRATQLGESHQNIIVMSGVRGKIDLIFEALVPYIPQWVLELAIHSPTDAFRALLHNRTVSAEVSHELIRVRQENAAMNAEAGKDLLTVMVRANATAKGSQKMSNLEMQQQIPSLMIAGQDTTGNTLSMALLELSKDAKLQEDLRAEVMEVYERNNGNLNYADVENMALLNAFLKEVVRVHPGLPMSDRVAWEDTVLPLSTPITNTQGQTITEIPISKGQHIVVATASFNRLESVWGPDADVFRPSRWLEGDPAKGPGFGPFAGLATFFGGPRVCIGWKFALTELQILLPVILRKFSFTLPGNVKIRDGLAVTMVPVDQDGKYALPLILEKIDE